MFNSNPQPIITEEVSLGVFNLYDSFPFFPNEHRRIGGQGNNYFPLQQDGVVNQNLPVGGVIQRNSTGIFYKKTLWSFTYQYTNVPGNTDLLGGFAFTENLCVTYSTNGSNPPTPSASMIPSNVELNEPSWVLFTPIWRFNGTTEFFIGLTSEFFKITSKQYTCVNLLKAQIADYFNGYFLDSTPYKVDIDLSLVLPISGNALIHYYFKEDEIQPDSDGIPHQTVSIQTRRIDIKKNIPFKFKLTCVPCSISLQGDVSVISQIKAQIESSYPNAFSDYLPIQQSIWENLYQQRLSSLQSQQGYYQSIDLDNKPYLWAATQRWGQQVINDRNTGLGIGENVLDSFVFDKYFKLNLDGTYGTDMADSALLKLIGSSLEVNTWGLNPDDPDVPRVDNLGWRINRLCDILGIRVNTDGTINPDKDKKLVTQVISSDKRLEPKDIGIVSFGKLEMVIKRINNRFKQKDEIVSDQCVIVQDIPQMIQEYFEQSNLALGLQESSAVAIKKGDDIAKFNNQLEILVELLSLAASSNEMVRSSLVSSLISQSQTNEIIAGIGLPSVTKTIPIKIDKKVHHLPYKGIAAHRSLSQEIATCTYNVGIATGQLL